MLIVYASRTDNVKGIVEKLENNHLRIETGGEKVSEPYILMTYTDGYGDIPSEVEDFLSSQHENIKAVIVSGDQAYGEAYGQAGDKIAETYQVPLLYKFENEGTDEDFDKIKELVQSF